MNREEMMRRMQMLGFVVADVGLFLDTHPYDEAAIQFYDKYRALYDVARNEFEAAFGPVSMTSVNIEDGWSWINQPWPWEMED